MSIVGDLFSALAGGGVTPPDRVWERIRAGAHLVDVRTPAEFAEGHLPGACNLPHDRIGERRHELPEAPDAEIVVYCRSGARSGKAAGTLRRMGFRRVLNGGGVGQLAAARPG